MKVIRVVLASVVLSGCAASQAQQAPQLLVSPPATIQYSGKAPVVEPHEPVALSKAEIAAVQKGVREAMKDPGSANFGTILAAKPKGVQTSFRVVCGYVNAKNSYGGYVGMKPFYGHLVGGAFVYGGVVGGSLDYQAVRELCRKSGMTV